MIVPGNKPHPAHFAWGAATPRFPAASTTHLPYNGKMRILSALFLVFSIVLCGQEGTSSKDKVKLAKDLSKRGTEGIAQLNPLLSDPDVEVRREAAKSLVSIGTQYSLDPLLTALKDQDSEVQIRATDGIINFYVPGYVESGLSGTLRRAGEAVTARWRRDESRDVIDPDIAVRPEIIDALGKLAAEPHQLVVRANAARAVGILRGRPALPALIDALKSKDDRLIFESLIAIQKLRDTEAGPRVVFLIRDLEEKIQTTAIETVGILKTSDAVHGLMRVFEEDPSKKVRRAAMIALGRIADPASHDFFQRYAADNDEEVRAGAAEGLGRIGNKADAAMLHKLYEGEGKLSARLAQAFALVSLGGVEMGEFTPLRDLLNNLNSKSWQGVAAPYLSELFLKEDVRKAVYPAIAAGTKSEKTGIAMSLASSRSADAVPPLEALMRDPDPEVGNTAVRALRILRATL